MVAVGCVSAGKTFPVVATEIEFYLHGVDAKFTPDEAVALVKEICDKSGIALASVAKERGKNQYEVALMPQRDVAAVARDTERFKQLLTEFFLPHNVKVDFSAKPIAGEPGSGLHVHVHLEDENGANLFCREGEEFSAHLLHAIGGLLEQMNSSMLIFAPYEESYLRFTAKSNAPTKVSWGTNNRTTAIRLPNKPANNKHIEHRVAGSDADVAKVIAAVLDAIDYGITEKCDPGEPVYGDASLPQYKLPLLAKSLEEAKRYAAPYANQARAAGK